MATEIAEKRKPIYWRTYRAAHQREEYDGIRREAREMDHIPKRSKEE